MEIHEALYTTRAMRRVHPEPIPQEVQARILDAAIRAPSGGNGQGWRFLLVDSPDVKAAIGPLYRSAMDQLWKTIYAEQIAAAQADPDSPAGSAMLTMQRSAQWLADNFEIVPLWMFAFILRDTSGQSIYPAVWSAQLAARAEGVGSALTSAIGYFHGQEVKQILDVPADEPWHFACCVSFGYPRGRWGVARRVPVQQVAYRNGWGRPIGFTADEPLWSP